MRRRGVASPRGVAGFRGALTGVGEARRFRRDLTALAVLASARSGRAVELSVGVLSDAGIRRMNRRFLRHDWTTDVVSFCLSDPEDPVLYGVLGVGRDTARREAARRGHSPYHELMLYVVHGVLHLLGHDDQGARARARMRRAEREVLSALGLPAVFGPDEGREEGP